MICKPTGSPNYAACVSIRTLMARAAADESEKYHRESLTPPEGEGRVRRRGSGATRPSCRSNEDERRSDPAVRTYPPRG
jgi:hypothetical protein